MLLNRTITVDGHRTSIRLEPEFWAGLAEIADREQQTIDQLCTDIDRGAGGLSRTAAVRVFITSYMVKAAGQATEQPQQTFPAATDDYATPRNLSDYPYARSRFRAAG